jgi:ribosomal protein S18 acetylase RimI-like enzyme
MSAECEIREEAVTAETLAEYGRIPIAFEVDRVLDVRAVDGDGGGFRLEERSVPEPWVKDYDAILGEGPTRWLTRFDVSSWGLLSAFAEDRRVGGAILVRDAPGTEVLCGPEAVVVLWDIRVRPERRGQGIGRRLFRAAEARAAARGCRLLKVETQNINVPACRFYAACGCRLGGIDRDAYREFPDEVALYWFRDLGNT